MIKDRRSDALKKQVTSLAKEVKKLKKLLAGMQASDTNVHDNDDVTEAEAYIMSICKKVVAKEVASLNESTKEKPKAVSLKSILKRALNSNRP